MFVAATAAARITLLIFCSLPRRDICKFQISAIRFQSLILLDYIRIHSYFSYTFSVLESIILIGMHSWYIARVMSFNRATLPPDAYRGLSESLSSVSVMFQTLHFKSIEFWIENVQ